MVRDEAFSERSDVMAVESSTAALINAAEIDQQITTAKKYPRSVEVFRKRALSLVTLNDQIARECVYALSRDGKIIEGPSARFAEVMLSQWGNCRAGARVINEGPEFVTAQGVFHDLEHNHCVTFEVPRRITTSEGKRYGPDMIGVTANAACSIALRNVILKGVPKAFWADIYESTRRTIAGDIKTLEHRRSMAIENFKAIGVTERQMCALIGVAGLRDVNLEHVVQLAGMLTALKEGDTTIDELDDHPVMRSGIRVCLGGLDGTIAFVEAADLREAVHAAEADPSRYLVLLDLTLPGVSGIESLIAFRAAVDPCPPVVVFSGTDDAATVSAALDAGAMGFIPKTTTPAILQGALRLVLAKGVYVPPSILGREASPRANPTAPMNRRCGHERRALHKLSELGLTPRQHEVCALMVKGRAIKQIARDLSISPATVKAHCSRSYRPWA